MIPQSTIDRILSAASIRDIIGEFVSLKKRGTHLVACCPFHNEDTPSFTVFPNSDTYKCFGYGAHGNAVNFLMEHEGLTYPEALKWLGKKYGIEIEEKQLTPKEELEYRMRESMWIANDIVAKKYAELLNKYSGARTYAYNRWGEKYCKQVGIGYCPPNARLIDDLGISKEVADELHLKNKGGYDFFGGRITIPILDKMQHVIGFTARAYDTDSNAKYMNSSESLVYNKSTSIFGINFAFKEASKTDRFYLVEGAPDCMRLQSIDACNSVAPLGTSWTEDHFSQLKRYASHLCFLPDADPPKQGEQFGPGVKAVIKSGEAAIRFGFSVSVKQIPVTEDKQDPDSYCENINVFNAIEETDYILWLADLLFVDGMTTEQQGKVVERLASIMACIENDTTIEMYVSQLVKYVPGKRMWQKAIEKQLNKQAEEEATAKAEKESDLYRQFGFNVEKDKYYYSISENGGMYVWSNFTMEPLFHIKDSVNPKRIYMLHNEFGVSELVEMKQEDLVSLQKFMVRVESLGNFIWKATQRELNKLKSFLYEKTETAEEIRQLGWHRYGFFAFGNGILYEGKFVKGDDYGIVRLKRGNFYLPANSKIYRDEPKLFQFERKFVHLGLSTIPLKLFTDQVFISFGDNGRVGFIYYLATLYRDIVTRQSRSFPILNLFGPKGSGKSELGHTLMTFFEIDNIPPNIQNSTLPALNDTVAAVANALVHIDEYKNDLDISKHEFLKGLWDGTGRTRMNMDLDKKKETTAVDSGIILSGQEMPTADIALFSRLIFLSFDKSEFTEEQKKNYQILQKMRSQGMTHLTIDLLGFRKKVEDEFPIVYHQTMTDLNRRLQDLVIEDRIMLNWLAPLAVFRCLESSIDTSLSYKYMLNLTVKGIIRQNSECKQNNELAAFWNMVQYLASEGEIMESGDFRIDYVRRLRTDLYNMAWGETKPVLYVQKSRIFMLYKKNGKAVGDTLLPEGSLKYYLEHSREYLGEKSGIRYTVYRKGQPVFEELARDYKGNPKKKTTVQRSYCFDYNLLCKNYAINLECAKDSDGDTAHQEDYDAEHPKCGTLDFDS